MSPSDQDQHRIPKVYLRLWSFKARGNADTLCVLKKGDPVAHLKSVKKFTAERNLFDTTIHEEGFERYFDEKCNIVETNYTKLLTALASDTYDGQSRIYLGEFVSNLFVRQRKTFEFLISIIDKEHLRAKFLNEIAVLEPKQNSPLIKAVYEEVAIDNEHTIESRVSAIILQGWKHYNSVVQRFNHVILKAPQERIWFTSDNPVITTNFGKNAFLMGAETEIYFALSKEYLVYMFLEGKETYKAIHSFETDSITEVSLEIYDDITKNVIIKSNPDYFILNEETSYYNAQSGEFEKKYRAAYQGEPHAYRGKISLMDTPTPPKLNDENLERLLVMLDAEFDPIELEVETHPDADENECIAIVDRLVREQGGKRILGRQIWEGPYIMEAEFHAVWEMPDGTLKDVSKKKGKQPYIVFVEDDKVIYEGKQISNVRLNLLKLPLVDDLIEVYNQEYRLLNKGERSLLYGRELNAILTQEQINNINYVLEIKKLIWTLLDSGGNENYPCPCKRGRKYKNCHGEHVKKLKKLS